MKANELMIGDWVQFPYGIRKVTELDSFLDRVCSEDFSVGEVDAIPLTPEILEMNGFERKLDNDGNHNRFTLTYEHTSFSLFYARSVFQWYCPLDFKYVHELQHALRLCGIEKEIEL